jgi:hypothetical protein
LWIGLAKLEGLNSDESVFHSIRCTYQNIKGELVVTNKGVVFLQITGILEKGRERLHQFDFDEIHDLQSDKKGLGLFKHSIMLDHRSPSLGNHTYQYSCNQYKVNLFLALFERQKLILQTPNEIESTIQKLTKPKGDADLLEIVKNPKMRSYFLAVFLEEIETAILSLVKSKSIVDLVEVAKNQQVESLIVRLHGSSKGKISQEQVFNTVKDLVSHLISRGDLEGIVTDEGSYVSKALLAQEKVPYQILADFASIHSQLKNKGIIIHTLECPVCNIKSVYPQSGEVTICQFCGTIIQAIDIFKKFKDLL